MKKKTLTEVQLSERTDRGSEAGTARAEAAALKQEDDDADAANRVDKPE